MNCADTSVINALELRGLSKSYGTHAAVDQVDLSLATGESLAIIGHNGAGKTTLMKLVLGLTRPSAGTIRRQSRRDGIPDGGGPNDSVGFLPESVAFPGTISARQMLLFYARLKHSGKRQCEELLSLVGLADAADQKISTFSKGMRQRLGLAQALLGTPDLLLLDEPTSGLDPFLRAHFYEIIGARQAAGTSVIISSHALTEIEARTDRIVIMKNGRIIVQGSLAQLRQQAALPIHILVRHQPGQAGALITGTGDYSPPRALADDQLEFSCNEQQKLGLLHQLSAREGNVLDIIVRPPRLDDLYTHFVNGDTQ